MLGKTNLTTIKDGAIVSDITEYSWNNAGISGITGSFIKAVFAGGFLVGITSDGDIAYTPDGENWEITRLNLERYYNLYDIIWDGERFAIVGSVSADGEEGEIVEHGIISMSEDFTDFSIIEDNENYYSRYCAILKRNGKYILIGARISSRQGLDASGYIFSKVGELNKWEKENMFYNIGCDPTIMEYIHINVGNNSSGFLVYLRYKSGSGSKENRSFEFLVSNNGIEYETIETAPSSTNEPYNKQLVSIYECKDILYYSYNHADFNYKLTKLINLDETAIISIEKNFAFVDAVYFNKCEIFINNHEMLIVTPSESIKDKTLGDLVDITYDFSMTAIVKAFDKLYIFGTGGNVLVSSDEVNNEEALAVKTMSASKALYEAKAYADTRYAELEARIEALEASDVTSS